MELIAILKKELSLEDFVAKRNKKIEKVSKEEFSDDYKLLSQESEKYLSFLLEQKNPVNYSFKNTKKASNLRLLNEEYYIEEKSKEYKLLGIFRLWNYLNYFFIKPNSKQIIENSLSKSIQYIIDNEVIAYEKALYNCYTNLNDGHSECFYQDKNKKRAHIDATLNHFGFTNLLPFKTFKVNDKFIIYEVIDKNNGLQKNDTIIKINNLDASYYYNEHFKAFSFMNSDSLKITTNRDEHLLLKSNSMNYGDYINSDNYISGLKNYYYISKFEKNEFTKLKKSIKNNDDVIIDCRNYPENVKINRGSEKLIQTPKRTLLYSFLIPKKKSISEYKTQMEINSRKSNYKGKITLIINKSTQSWAEFIVLSLSMNDNVEIIGTYSSNAIGQCDYILPLPGNYFFMTSTYFGIPNTKKYDLEKGIVSDIFLNDWEIESFLKNRQAEIQLK